LVIGICLIFVIWDLGFALIGCNIDKILLFTKPLGKFPLKAKTMNNQPRKVIEIIKPQTVMEGAGVRLKRSIATATLDHLDPFLLFDHFGSDNPDDYIKGFPIHPHRGIETVTYMINGHVNHKDSIGNSGSIGSGDIQWMTAGGGIMHEEMPQPAQGEMVGFQLWVNLPARLKMTKPRYQGILSNQIPEVTREDGVKIRVIAGEVDGVRGAISEIFADPAYLDVSIPAKGSFSHPVEKEHTAFAYVFEGRGFFGTDENAQQSSVSQPGLVVLGDGDYIRAGAANEPVRFLLISGKPLNEPIARYGPFVMNTQEEIQQALKDLKNGTFVRN
jgi:redox-sensitive bicupin YhaK (pirin superfamily)